jgi:hypothetical protein
VNRILRTKVFHCPAGRPKLPRARERAWRHELVEAALQLLQREVARPTVFEVEELLARA